jgi:hypothetical protein
MVAQSLEQPAFSILSDSCEESVNALPKFVGFLRVLRFPPTGKVDRADWDKHIVFEII